MRPAQSGGASTSESLGLAKAVALVKDLKARGRVGFCKRVNCKKLGLGLCKRIDSVFARE